MHLSAALTTSATAADVLKHVASLDAYSQWMPLVHSAVRETEATPPAWNVELRAKVGPLARSKRLRMVRTVYEIGESSRIVFERAETDGRRHANWRLEVTVGPRDGSSLHAEVGETQLVMNLSYDGRFFVSVVESILRQNIEVGKRRLGERLAA
jgi:hypothetical protein